MVFITDTLSISEDELQFNFIRSSGPGGQNVNKVNSCVRLSFSIPESQWLSQSQKDRLMHKLKGRINQEGVLQLVCQVHRTQLANRKEVVKLFQELLVEALRRPKPRKRKRMSKAAKERRIHDRKKQSQKKQLRSKVKWDG